MGWRSRKCLLFSMCPRAPNISSRKSFSSGGVSIVKIASAAYRGRAVTPLLFDPRGTKPRVRRDHHQRTPRDVNLRSLQLHAAIRGCDMDRRATAADGEIVIARL